VIAVSGHIRQTLIDHGTPPERVTTILNGIEPEVFKRNPAQSSHIRASLSIPNNRVVIGSVGRLEPEKRFDLLMTAFARLRASRPNLMLVIAGDGTLRRALEAQSRQLGLDHCLRLLGHRIDIADLHHAFDLFVQSSDHEGTPNAVLEAMALQTPVVATSAGGTAELIEDSVHGLIVPHSNLDALAQAIANALANPAASLGRALAARRRVESTLSFQARTRAVERIYDELMATRNSLSDTTRRLHA
jgi:glycosyltransferase involved in cell wall biosynthesis